MGALVQLDDYKELQKSTGGLSTIKDGQLAKIAERMVEIDRASHTAGKQNTQTTSQLMSLTMLNDSPYRRLRQCLSQIEDRRKALDDSYYRLQKKQLMIKHWYDKGDEMSVLRAKNAEYKMQRSKDYIDGAFKEIAVFQEAYEEIRETYNIPIDWDEKDFELEEIAHHLRMAFRNCHRDLIQDGRMNMGTMEYLEQNGVHPQAARKIVMDYITKEEEMISKGKLPTVNSLYSFLDSIANDFKDAHKMVMDRIGIKKIIREEFLYLEGKDND